MYCCCVVLAFFVLKRTCSEKLLRIRYDCWIVPETCICFIIFFSFCSHNVLTVTSRAVVALLCHYVHVHTGFLEIE